ncbi:MAG TPA: condensation domain-containing protein, partial [Terrimicrobiaceae bacterium]
ILLGIYMAKRNAPEADAMMGYFCEVGVLRTEVSSDLSFLALLSRVRETVVNAHAHEEMPFDVLGEELKKNGQTPPDVRAIFTFETFSQGSWRLGDLEVNPLGIAIRKSMPWRFSLRVRDEGGVFSGLAKFDARLHDPHLVRKMMRRYVRLLEAVVEQPAARLCDIEEKLGR